MFVPFAVDLRFIFGVVVEVDASVLVLVPFVVASVEAPDDSVPLGLVVDGEVPVRLGVDFAGADFVWSIGVPVLAWPPGVVGGLRLDDQRQCRDREGDERGGTGHEVS